MRGGIRVLGLGLLVVMLLSFASARADRSVVLTFAGDCTLGSEEALRDKDYSFDSYAARYGYDHFFAGFKDIFASDDLTLVNLEGVLSNSRSTENRKKKYCFRGPADFAAILSAGSVDAVSLANNHTSDYGSAGLADTRKALEEHGIIWVQNTVPYLYQQDNITVAVFGLDHGNLFDQWLLNEVRRLKASGEADAIVIFAHHGNEYRPGHEYFAADRSRRLVEAGADLILMHSPHVLQGMDVIQNRTVFYSLGNFVFGGNKTIRRISNPGVPEVSSLYTAVVQARLSFTGDGRYLGQRITVFPAYTSDDPEANHYQPQRLTAQEAVPVRDAIQYDTPFELPALTEKEGFARMDFDYLPAFDDVLIPEDDE